MIMKNALNWFEIPSIDFERAVAFYEAILGEPLRKEVIAGTPNGVFPYSSEDDFAVGGSVFYDARVKPSQNGTTPYLNCAGKLDEVLARVPAAGGTVILPSTDIGFGSIALIIDCEGNRVGLHTP
jgi:predicted enzyme related to lactoylglutathione lyase